jgi:hypothetical protein
MELPSIRLGATQPFLHSAGAVSGSPKTLKSCRRHLCAALTKALSPVRPRRLAVSDPGPVMAQLGQLGRWSGNLWGHNSAIASCAIDEGNSPRVTLTTRLRSYRRNEGRWFASSGKEKTRPKATKPSARAAYGWERGRLR